MNHSQYQAVEQCVQYLKEHSNFRGLFINYGSRIRVKKIINRIENGDENLLEFLRSYSSPRECATALNIFLQDIGKPLISKRVQCLILSNNYGVCPRIIALDALSLLYEDLHGVQRSLFISIMDMMKTLSTYGSLRPTELRVSHAPYLLMPLLFSASKESQECIAKNWKSIADILNEMVLNFDLFLNGGHFQLNSSIYVIMVDSDNEQQSRPSRLSRQTNINQVRSMMTRNSWPNNIEASYMLRIANLFI